MSASVRENSAGLRSKLDQRRDDPGMAELPGQLFAVADLISQDTQLRSALSDAGQPSATRVGLVHAVFDGRVSSLAVEVLADVVALRWSSPNDFVEVVEALATQAALMNADREGSLEQVEGDLFAFSQTVSGSADLQMALTDPSVGAAQKAGLVETLLSGRSTPQTIAVLSYAMGHLRGRRVDTVMDDLMDLAGEQRNRSIAEVRVARPLDPDQATRLAAALSRLNGRDVRLNVVVDPDVIGGISVRIGDEVIDATVATRIEQARRVLIG
jgi:F-type H+-transporting ATPase subunit delta